MFTLSEQEFHRSNYRLLGLVGQGQFGRVYCASHRKTGQLVALKELDRQRFPTHKFLRELRFLLSLQHPNIVTWQALEHIPTGRYLVMDYCEGGTLRSLLEDDVRLHPRQTLKLVTQVLAGLDHAHQRGIVHCDIKPENILLTVKADGWLARISDFGIARLSQELVSEGFSNTGSPAYMAPERFYGQYSPGSDVYAVGVLLFELLMGYRPFSGLPADLMSAHLNQMVTIPPEIPPELGHVLLTALQKLPARRFRSAGAMLESLQMASENAAIWFNQNWSNSILLRSPQPLESCPFQSQFQAPIQARITQLVADCHPSFFHRLLGTGSDVGNVSTSAKNPCFFRVSGKQIVYQSQNATNVQFSNPLQSQDPLQSDDQLQSQDPLQIERVARSVRLLDPILDLVICPQVGFAIAQQAIYRLSPWVFGGGECQLEQGNLGDSQATEPFPLEEPSMPELIKKFKQDVQVAISPQGRWMATATVGSEQTRSHLNFWNLQHLPLFKPLYSFEIDPCFRILALDAHHLLVFSHLADPNSTCINGVCLQAYTRRGSSLGSLRLEVPLRQVYPTPTPYRLLALEPGYPSSLLFLDLKPLRIHRVGLEIVPQLIMGTSWGYVLVSKSGELLLLNQYGQGMGRVDGPPNPTAIAPLSSYEFVLATWDGTQGTLYKVDLQQLELNVIF